MVVLLYRHAHSETHRHANTPQAPNNTPFTLTHPIKPEPLILFVGI